MRASRAVRLIAGGLGCDITRPQTTPPGLHWTDKENTELESDQKREIATQSHSYHQSAPAEPQHSVVSQFNIGL